MQVFLESLPRALFEITTKATLLLCVSWLVTLCMAKCSAAIRHRIWSLTMLALLALPVLSWQLPDWQWAILPNATLKEPMRITQSRSAAPVNTSVPIAPDDDNRFIQTSTRVPTALTPAQMTPTSEATEITTPASLQSPTASSAAQSAPIHATDAHLPADQPTDVSPSLSESPVPNNWKLITVLVVYFSGCIVSLSAILVGVLNVRSLSRRSIRIEQPEWQSLLNAARMRLRTRRRIDLRQCAESFVPLTWGVFRPAILLPEAASAWSLPVRNAVLLHELAHIQRNDVALHLMGRLVCTLYWFHPVAWLALHRMRLERELACDDAVISAGETASNYAETLLQIARAHTHPHRLSLAIGMAQRSNLERRLRIMFDSTRGHSPLNRRTAVVAFLFTTALVVTVAALKPVASASAGSEPGLSSTSLETQAASQPEHSDASDTSDAPPEAHNSPALRSAVKGTIKGTILIDSTKAPAANAEVCLIKRPYESFSLPLNPAKAVANQNGEFEFQNLEPGKYLLYSHHGELTTRSERCNFELVTLDSNGVQRRPLQLLLRPGLTLKVRVTSALDGRPVASAHASLYWTDLHSDDFVANEHGEIVLNNLTPEKWYLSVTAKGHSSVGKHFNVSDQETIVDVVLPLGREIQGTVVDANGNPFPNAEVSAMSPANAPTRDRAVTDEEGRFRLEGLSRDSIVSVSAYAEGYEAGSAIHRPGEPEVTLSLKPIANAGSVNGTVLDAQGQPVEGATVRNYGNSSKMVQMTESGKDGSFRFDRLYAVPNKSPVLIIRAAGHAPKKIVVEENFLNGEKNLSVQLEAGYTLEGQIKNKEGLPVDDCIVYFNGRNEFGGEIGSQTSTDSDGRFLATDLPRESTIVVSVRGYSQHFSGVLDLAQIKWFEAQLDPIAVIFGNVMDRKSGAPVREFAIKWLPSGDNGDPNNRSRDRRFFRDDPGGVFISDPGHFLLNRYNVGTSVELHVSAPGYVDCVLKDIVAQPRDSAKPFKIELVPTKLDTAVSPTAPVSNAVDTPPKAQPAAAPAVMPEPQPAVKGRVKGTILFEATKAPAANAEVCMIKRQIGSYGFPLTPVKTVSNEAGEFVFNDVEPGEYRLYSFVGNMTTRTRMVKFEPAVIDANGVQQQPVNLLLKRGVTLTVRLKSESTGEPVTNAYAQQFWTDLNSDHYTANEQGEIVIHNLTAQRWHLEVVAEGHAKVVRDLNLTAQDTVLDLTLPRGHVISGTVVDNMGKPIPDASVGVQPRESGMFWFDSTSTNSQGQFRLKHIPKDVSLEVSASAAGYDRASINHELGDQELRIVLDPMDDVSPFAGTVKGLVLQPNGRPAAGVMIRNYGRSSTEVRETVSAVDGMFRLDNVYKSLRGMPELYIRADGFAPQRVKVDSYFLDGKRSLTLKLLPGHTVRGRIFDDQGVEIKGATVTFYEGDYDPWHIDTRIKTDSEGRFDASSLPRNTRINVWAEGYTSFSSSYDLEKNEPIEITLDPIGQISGTVLDKRTGTPIKDFTISIRNAEGVGRLSRSHDGIEVSRTIPGESFVNDEGAFVLERLALGSAVDITVTAPGYRARRIRSQIAVPKDREKPLKIELEPAQ